MSVPCSGESNCLPRRVLAEVRVSADDVINHSAGAVAAVELPAAAIVLVMSVSFFWFLNSCAK